MTTYATKAKMQHALDFWKSEGYPVGAMELRPNGTIRLETPQDPVDNPKQKGKPKEWTAET